MRGTAAAMALMMAFSSMPVPAAAGHLVAPSTVDRALADAASAAAGDRARVEAMLATESARQTAERLGADMATLRQAAARLTEAERRDLLARAESLASDPDAGHFSADVNQLLVLLLIVLIVVVLLDAVD